MLKKIIAGLLLFIIILTTIGFFLPDKITLTKSISIKAPIKYVFEEINELERWADWSYQQKRDPSMEVIYGDRKSGKMASFSWRSDDGEGRLHFAENFPDTSIATEIFFSETDTAFVNYKLKHRKDTTSLMMNFHMSNFNNPFDRWIAMLRLKPKIEKNFNYELQKIKDIAEAKPIFTIKITEESLAPTYYISIKGKINSKNTEIIFAEKKKMFLDLKTVFKESNAAIVGPPFCIYPDNIVDVGDVIYALPMSPDSKFPSAYPVSQHYSGAAIKGIHIGAFDSLAKTHKEIKQYVAYKKFQLNGAPWEVYVRDPTKESDVKKRITEVYYPVK